MRAKILISLMLASVCSAEIGWLPLISPLTSEESNGKTEFFLNESDERLDDYLTNPDPRVCDKINVKSVPIEAIRRIFEVYGKQATKLRFGYSADVTYKAQDVLDVINMLPNLEELSFEPEGEKALEGEVEGSLGLKNLYELEIHTPYDNCIDNHLKFFAKILPQNILKSLELNGKTEDYDELFNRQRSIKSLKFEAEEFVFNEAFNSLSLEYFNTRSWSNDFESLLNFRNFIKSVVKSQPNLTYLNFDIQSNEFNIIDDELLKEISRLSKLENFELTMEGEGLTSVDAMKNFKSLKELKLRSNKKKSIKLFNQFSYIKLESLEKLTILCFGFDVPAEDLARMSQNLPNLKTLYLRRNVHLTINFFAATFPQIDELIMLLGSSSEPFKFSDAIERNTKITQQNIKRIYFEFKIVDGTFVDAEDFVEMLKIFPNLEELSVEDNFPFSTNFFTKIVDNIGNLKDLSLKPILISDDEKFAIGTSKALKALAGKLQNLRLMLHRKENENAFKNFFGGFFGSSDENFSFQPLIDETKDVFKFYEGGNRLLEMWARKD